MHIPKVLLIKEILDAFVSGEIFFARTFHSRELGSMDKGI